MTQGRWLLIGLVLIGCYWPPADAYAMCEVHTSNRTYADGMVLNADVCDSTGARKVTGGGGGTQYQEDTQHSTGDSGTLALGVRKDTAATLANLDGDYTAPIFDASGRLWINCGTGCSGGTQYAEDNPHANADTGTMALGVRKDTPVALAADGDYMPMIFDSSGYLWVRNYNPNLAADNSSNSSSKVPVLPCVAATSDPSWTNTNQVPCSTDLAGYQRSLAKQSGTWTVQPGNTANTTPWLFSNVPATSGGTSTCYLSSAATTNATNCKASAGQIYGYDLVNTTATLYYLRLYNLSASPTCSSATGFIRTIPVPASATGAGIARDIAQGEAYGTGIGFCLTGGGSSTDNTSAATGVYVSIHFK